VLERGVGVEEKLKWELLYTDYKELI